MLELLSFIVGAVSLSLAVYSVWHKKKSNARLQALESLSGFWESRSGYLSPVTQFVSSSSRSEPDYDYWGAIFRLSAERSGSGMSLRLALLDTRIEGACEAVSFGMAKFTGSLDFPFRYRFYCRMEAENSYWEQILAEVHVERDKNRLTWKTISTHSKPNWHRESSPNPMEIGGFTLPNRMIFMKRTGDFRSA